MAPSWAAGLFAKAVHASWAENFDAAQLSHTCAAGPPKAASVSHDWKKSAGKCP